MWTRMRAAALIVAALTLASCGSIHPGDAAVVDGHSISMTKFDKTARIYCKLTLLSAQEQGVTSVPNSDVRRQTISDLVTIHVARDLAKEEGITVDKKLVRALGRPGQGGRHGVPQGRRCRECRVRDRELAGDRRDRGCSRGEVDGCRPPPTRTSGQLAEEGRAAIIAAFKDHDVKFAPRFGLSSSLKEIGPTGSLSVPKSRRSR